MTTTSHESITLSDEAFSLLAKVRALAPQDQAKIAACLIDSLEPSEDRLDDPQLAEILRRSDEVDRGAVTLIPADEAMRLYRNRTKV